ncbi:ATP-dependent 6-phosphofructokinase [Arenibaculum sp.]|jgi:6-phosphofructokinase 1|uniref:ATP-dependent 6-phosphofructokinase n=1 Tax=Arenibaculum sp. TaxID=2865862 RepID=UPI002E15A967|nr:ATP-dependent 6-phosphofructokinase [Arenibaculum sp.]
MSSEKRIGILTSGGDCAGLNAVIRAAVHRATLTYGWQVVGIREGTMGLLARPVRYDVLDLGMVSGTMMRLGGTILGTTNKGDPFAFPMADGTVRDRSVEIIGGYRELGLDALIGIGGDGSFAILRRLAAQGGINLVGIPKTIDNDVGLTETAIGFDTAVAVATEALDRLQPTAASHARVMVLEVMGRDAGHIAVAAGIAGGADVILIPEIPYRIESVADKIRQVRQQGRNFALVVVSEAVRTADGKELQREFTGGQKRFGGIGDYIGEQIAAATGAETRVTVLGHVQRGSMPSPRDRLIASAFGVHAVDLIAAGKFDRMVAWQNRQVVDVPLEDAIADYNEVELDGALVRTARGLGICLGD